MYIWRNAEEPSCKNHYRGKTITFECVFVGLFSQNAKRVRRIILLPVAWPAVPYISTLSYIRHEFRGKKFLDVKCRFWFFLRFWSETSNSKQNSARHYRKCALVFVWSTQHACQILMNFWFSQYMERLKYQISRNFSCPTNALFIKT
jgi:hypothetical protein